MLYTWDQENVIHQLHRSKREKTLTPMNRVPYSSHCTDKSTETQRGEAICSRWDSGRDGMWVQICQMLKAMFLDIYTAWQIVSPLWDSVYSVHSFFFNVYLFEREREREREHQQGSNRERGRHRTQSRLQAPSCEHSPTWGSNLQTVRSWLAPKLDIQPTETFKHPQLFQLLNRGMDPSH